MEEELQVKDIRSQQPDEPNHRFLNESEHLEKRWTTIGELDGIEEKYKRQAIAVCLENQRLMNECATINYDFNKKLIPLVRYVFGRIKAWDWVNIQPMLGPTGLIYYMCRRPEGVCIESEEITARTRCLRHIVADDFGPKDAALRLAHEIETEIITDLWNCSGARKQLAISKYDTDASQALRQQVVLLQDDIRQKGLEPTFLIVNTKLYSKLRDAFTNLGNGISIYPHDSVQGVLVGHRGESYMDAGYAYSPYIPFTLTPRADGLHGFIMRYGKKLSRGGGNYYGSLRVDGTINENEHPEWKE